MLVMSPRLTAVNFYHRFSITDNRNISPTTSNFPPSTPPSPSPS
ncbi:hypothetical protein SNOG_08174 [Parastagonospora nodorum SN15]|uniref:Uncharacterized protein n=1 Tax=Phaeosphaeria nodorum (strain SN15 / ATCC MYA-4574 / FGSC 10173) TaxID=321614 RepID=Q0UJ90_PHANO|nr:hypothetical protein SNOG_08174 [Parastagonospora nodorum SN15]EAT84450.1 hypothetical protein SNOG_08174 [Parastagonospora nodorum SN15]